MFIKISVQNDQGCNRPWLGYSRGEYNFTNFKDKMPVFTANIPGVLKIGDRIEIGGKIKENARK